MGLRRSQTGTGRRRHRRGQSLVEFALVAPVFLSLMFGIAEGGILMYIFNSAQHAATYASEIVAADGSDADTDTSAIAAVQQNTDFGGSGLVTITGYDFWLLNPDGSGARDTDSCSADAAPCHQHYDGNGNFVYGNWPPGARHTTSANADYVELDITYDYHYFFDRGAVLHFTAQRFFRLEPET